jgi:hypothetical protein
MATRPVVGLFSSMLVFGLVAGLAPAAVPQDVQCAGTMAAATVRNVTVPSGGSCTLLNSNVTGRVSAGAGAYLQATGTSIAGDIVGNDAQTLFVERGSRVNGSIQASRVAQVFLFSSRVRKNVEVDHATDQIFICGSTIERGSIKVIRSARDILIGGSRSDECGGNTVRRGDMAVLWNTTDVQLVVKGNRFPKGNLLVAGNTGPSQKLVQGNSGGRRIACRANAGSFRGVQNRRWKSGGCGRS